MVVGGRGRGGRQEGGLSLGGLVLTFDLSVVRVPFSLLPLFRCVQLYMYISLFFVCLRLQLPSVRSLACLCE